MQDKITPVYVAASYGQVGALKVLISAGANFNTANVVSIEFCLYYTIFGIQIRGKVQK